MIKGEYSLHDDDAMRLSPLLTEADCLCGVGPFGSVRVMASATERGVVFNWRDVSGLAVAEGKSGFGRPRQLLDILAALQPAALMRSGRGVGVTRTRAVGQPPSRSAEDS
jgi:hypothetical protein